MPGKLIYSVLLLAVAAHVSTASDLSRASSKHSDSLQKQSLLGRRLTGTDAGQLVPSNVTPEAGALSLDGTLKWLHIWYEVMLPALQRSKGAWTELGSPCAVQAMSLARQVYERAHTLAKSADPQGVQDPTPQQQQQGASGAGGGDPLSILLFRLLDALDACQRSINCTGSTLHRSQAAHALLHTIRPGQRAALSSGPAEAEVQQQLAQLADVSFEPQAAQAALQDAQRHLRRLTAAGVASIPISAPPPQPYKGAYPIVRRLTLAALHALQLALEARQARLRVKLAVATAQAGPEAVQWHAEKQAAAAGKVATAATGVPTSTLPTQATSTASLSISVTASSTSTSPSSSASTSWYSKLGFSLLSWLTGAGRDSQKTQQGTVTAVVPGSGHKSATQQQVPASRRLQSGQGPTASSPGSARQALDALHSQLTDVTQDLQDVQVAGRAAVLLMRHVEQCSHSLRPIMEGLHVSKSGGTSMCELARLAGKQNPGFNPTNNCKLPEFQLSPRWGRHGRYPEFVPEGCRKSYAFWVVPKSTCDQWIQMEQAHSCQSRLATLQAKGVTWHMNEVSLYRAKSDDPYSSQPCTNHVVTLMMLRDPMERVLSHISHLTHVYEDTMRDLCRTTLKLPAKDFPKWDLPKNLTWLSWAAPQTLDNAALRYLVGRHAHCRDLDLPRGSSLTQEDFASGLARLMALDHVLVIGQAESNLTEVVMRLGMGWPMTLMDVTFRKQSTSHRLEADLGFPAGSEVTLRSLNKWDSLLTESGRAMLSLDAAYYSTAAALMATNKDHLGSGSSARQQHTTSTSTSSLNASACELLLSPEVPLVRLRQLLAEGDAANLEVLRSACHKSRIQNVTAQHAAGGIMAFEYTGAREQQAVGLPRSFVQQLLMFGVRLHKYTTSLPRLSNHSPTTQ